MATKAQLQAKIAVLEGLLALLLNAKSKCCHTNTGTAIRDGVHECSCIDCGKVMWRVRCRTEFDEMYDYARGT